MTDTDAGRSGMEELALRCEQATGPDRELDIAICEALGLVPADYERASCHGVPHPYYWHRTDSHAPYISPERYTSSLDAAMTLYIRAPERVPAEPLKACAEALRQRIGHE